MLKFTFCLLVAMRGWILPLFVLSLLLVGGNGRILETNCSANDQCAENEFCAYDFNECDGTAGVCTPIPTACDSNSPDSLVCGCNGVTYRTPCSAKSSRASLLSDTPCAGDSTAATESYGFYNDNGNNGNNGNNKSSASLLTLSLSACLLVLM